MSDGRDAAWHPDPDDPSQYRYWDGTQWTDHRSPRGGESVDSTAVMPQAEQSASAQPPPKKNTLLYVGIPVAACIALFVVAGIVGAVAGGPDDEERATSDRPSPPPSSVSTEAIATTVPPTTVTVPPETTTTAAPTTTAPPATTAPPTTEAKVPMPDVVCMNLQVAQDTIQVAGVFFSRSEDATGQGRNQLFDSNWIVVAQTPAPGTPVGELEAVLSAVKIGEPNPC